MNNCVKNKLNHRRNRAYSAVNSITQSHKYFMNFIHQFRSLTIKQNKCECDRDCDCDRD